MESPKEKSGRPPKNGVKDPRHLWRALIVIYGYTRARERGEKHTAALEEAVDFVRQLEPKMRISKSEVRRVLAELRPKDSQLALTVKFSILEGEEAARCRSFHAQTGEFAGPKSTRESIDQNLRKPLKSFKFGFTKRPKYPRHNATDSTA